MIIKFHNHETFSRCYHRNILIKSPKQKNFLSWTSPKETLKAFHLREGKNSQWKKSNQVKYQIMSAMDKSRTVQVSTVIHLKVASTKFIRNYRHSLKIINHIINWWRQVLINWWAKSTLNLNREGYQRTRNSWSSWQDVMMQWRNLSWNYLKPWALKIHRYKSCL